MFAGFSLAVWSTGIMYASDINSPFTAYLLGYAFPPIFSGLIILLGIMILRSSKPKREEKPKLEKEPDKENNEVVDQPQSKETSNISLGTSFMQVGNRIRSMHISYNEKLGTTTFYLGLLILLFSSLLSSDQMPKRKESLAGDAIAFFSAFFGIVFQWIFINYSMRNLNKIVEFLMMMYLFAALFITVA